MWRVGLFDGMIFTEIMWERIAKTSYAAILRHPFIIGMSGGNLSEKALRHYVVQHCLFTKDYSRGINLLAARSEDDLDLLMFCEYARETINATHTMHKNLLGAWNMTNEDVEKADKKPNCLLYTSYLLHTVYSRPYYESIGAVLPAVWVYRELAIVLQAHSSANPYSERWIETYANEKYSRNVSAMIDMTDRICAELASAQKEAVSRHFEQTAKFEWLFWDMGYHLQQWPV